jgi:hypothetical protein
VEHQSGQLRLDSWSPTADVGQAVASITADLAEAAITAHRAGRALDAAQQVLAHLAASVDNWAGGADDDTPIHARED